MSHPVSEWSVYEKHVLKKLEELEARYSKIDEKLTNLRIEVGSRKHMTAVIWGILGGSLPFIVAHLLKIAP